MQIDETNFKFWFNQKSLSNSKVDIADTIYSNSEDSSAPQLPPLSCGAYGPVLMVTFPRQLLGCLFQPYLSPPALLTGMTRRDPDCTLTQSLPMTLARALATTSQEALLSPEPNLQGFVLSLPKSHMSLNILSLSSKLLSLRFYFTLLTS